MSSQDKSYGYLGVDMPRHIALRMALLQRAIPKEDLYTEKGGHGLERHPHVTVAYGHEEDDPTSTKEALADMIAGEGSIGGISTFDNPDYQVLKFDVDSDDLRALNARLRERIAMPGNTFTEYNPHVTVAYLKPGADVSRYAKLEKLLKGQRFPVRQLRFGNPADQYTTLVLADKLDELQKTADLKELLQDAELTGSRGRALHYGRPEPEGRDYDYTIFEDDPDRRAAVRAKLQAFAETSPGFRYKPRPDRDGGTATSEMMDISVYDNAHRAQLMRAWELMEGGMSKDDAWAQVENEYGGPLSKTAAEVEYSIREGARRYKPMAGGKSVAVGTTKALATVDGRQVGTAELMADVGGKPVLRALKVLGDHRNKGIGRGLVKKLLADADAKGTGDIYLRANPYEDEPMTRQQLMDFYATFGFVPGEAMDETPDGRYPVGKGPGAMIRKKAGMSALVGHIRKDAQIILDIDIGDTVLVGRFKNKPVKVQSIGTDENGQPTINGRKLLALRIAKLLPKSGPVAATTSAAAAKYGTLRKSGT